MSEANRLRANAIRALSMDAVQAANSGHPGMPMGMADIAEALWCQVLNHNPRNPSWPNRDRFVLSNGHGSMLLYSLLHLTGYELSLDDLKNFRQLHSKTPGHPENFETPGIETTTGPLGQGLANAVGMAIGERLLATQFNQDNHTIIDHYTYAFCGDGCLMEGISHEVSSLAGTLGLGKLIVFYDDNGISIDGNVEGWFTDDTAKRFEAYGFEVIKNVDGHDSDAIIQAITDAKQNQAQPTLIQCKTTIGFGSPNVAGTAKSHGAPLGLDEITATKKALNWPYAEFEVPDKLYKEWSAVKAGHAKELGWNEAMTSYRAAHPELAQELDRRLAGDLPEGYAASMQAFIQTLAAEQSKVATRKASELCLDQLGALLPELLGGSADLAGSNNTRHKDSRAIRFDDFSGNYINYGVREFGMGAIMNGLSLYGGFIPYGGTFLVFADYAKNAIRLSAMNDKKVVYVLTHDSIGLGEDGPTHQPIEQAAMLRMTPKLHVWRPCDSVETAVSWQQAIDYDGASCLLLSRQGLEPQQHNEQTLANIKRGGYILKDCDGTPELILIATGSEVALAMEAQASLGQQGKKVRVVSMPSTNVFDKQDTTYREQVLPSTVRARIAIEALHIDTWYKYVGLDGVVIGMNSFGLSAPANEIFKAMGITAEAIVDSACQLINNQ